MRPYDNKKVLIFLGGNNFLEGLFDTINTQFIKNILALKPAHFSHVLMTIIVPKHMSDDQHKILSRKKSIIKRIVRSNGATIDFCHIHGRTIPSIIRASKEISKKIRPFQKRYIWAHNYYHCLLGILLKKQRPDTHLHFDVMGLVPEEELYYSESNMMNRLIKFLALKIIGRINFYFADSVSVVSNRFKSYIISRYHLDSTSIDVIPNFYDNKIFFPSHMDRALFRQKYDIKDWQKLILYSGMLQKWQRPDILFALIKKLQMKDVRKKFRFMLMTYDLEKARQYCSKYTIKDLIIDAGNANKLNGVYNAADICIACRSSDMVSKVSSPVKIPEYLATQNSIILLESIGDFGIDLKTKNYALVKKHHKDLLNTSLKEVKAIKKPDESDLNDIFNKYCLQSNKHIFRKIIEKQK